MKNISPPRAGSRYALCLLLCGVLLLVGGCARPTETPAPIPSATPMLVHASVTPAPTLEDEPAIVYSHVLTDKRVVSLILEGFTDDGTMQSSLYALKSAGVPAVFFVSGIVADEHPQTVKLMASEGFVVGNYGLNAQKNMQDNDVLTNIHQFQRCQELIEKAIGSKPTLFRCNGTTYTREVLQAAAHVGLRAGVQPNVFLNHSSFAQYENALQFVQKLARGSIISIKLGQVLDTGEYEGTQYNMDYLAIDPSPMLSDKMEDIAAQTYANIVNVVGWLLQALEEEGYVVVSPEALQAERITMFDAPAELDSDTLALLSPDSYALPVSKKPLTNIAPSPTASPTPEGSVSPEATPSATPSTTLGDGLVFIGDSVTLGLQNYVEWRRETQPDYLIGTQFLTSADFSIGMSQMRVSSSSVHPTVGGVKMAVDAALQKLGAKVVFLMPGQTDVRNYTVEKFIDNLKLMIYQIRKTNPGIRLYLQSIPPGVAGRYTKPTNEQVFACNLAMYKLCLQFGIPFMDTAYALRDDQGNLPDTLCLDADTYGIHLNDAGCEQWIQFLRGYMPY